MFTNPDSTARGDEAAKIKWSNVQQGNEQWDREYAAVIKANAEKTKVLEAQRAADALQKRKDDAALARELFDPRTSADKDSDFERQWNAAGTKRA
jgi:hypothetical protein